MLRYYVSKLLGLLLTFFFKNKVNEGILSVYFHNPSYLLFEYCIKELAFQGYRFISLEVMTQLLEGKLNSTEKMVVITFDDGWRDNLKLLPIINKYKVHATFFIPTDAIENGNFWWEYSDKANDKNNTTKALKRIENKERIRVINKLKNTLSLERSALTKEELIAFEKNPLITIGSHTVSHPITINCSDDELKEEFNASKKILEYWIGKEILFFAYPNGDYDDRDLKYLEKSGYKFAFTTKPGVITADINLLELPRYSINSDGSFQENKAKMFGLWQKIF